MATRTQAVTGSERRGVDALRAEALANVMTMVEDRNFGGLRNQVHWVNTIKPSRIILLLVAIVAGGAAAYLATQQPRVEPAAVTEVVEEVRTRVLVARGEIGLGQRITPDAVEWQDWPESAVRAEYITQSSAPEGAASMIGAVARFEIFPGEPIRMQKLAVEGQGILSAVLESGTRGVSVVITAESASGGFIMPNDHVDVVATRAGEFGRASETILHNVRVLAINTRLGEAGTTGAPTDPNNPQADIFAGQAIATLALDPKQAEVVIGASAAGPLSLVLLSLVDVSTGGNSAQIAANAAIRISSPFWAQ